MLSNVSSESCKVSADDVALAAYAATEAGSVSTSMFVDDPDTCGVPTPGVEIKVVDRATGNALGPNQVGEC